MAGRIATCAANADEANSPAKNVRRSIRLRIG
jgi:hypothetical protein